MKIFWCHSLSNNSRLSEHHIGMKRARLHCKHQPTYQVIPPPLSFPTLDEGKPSKFLRPSISAQLEPCSLLFRRTFDSINFPSHPSGTIPSRPVSAIRTCLINPFWRDINYGWYVALIWSPLRTICDGLVQGSQLIDWWISLPSSIRFDLLQQLIRIFGLEPWSDWL